MSCLHIWFSKLKWSMDVLLRFYERHGYICGLHKETRLLFDELLFCLQRLYSIPFRTADLPFSADLLEAVPSTRFFHSPPESQHQQNHQSHGSQCQSCCTSCGNTVTLASSCGSNKTVTTPNSDYSSSGATSSRKGSGKSRIPRPISLPKRLEAKLGVSPTSPVRSAKIKPALTNAASRKSRVRDTIKLFDGKHGKPPISGGGRRSASSGTKLKSPKTGGGEGMLVGFESGGSVDSNSRR